MELLCHKVDVHLFLQDTAEEFSRVNLVFQVPINSAGDLFYIFTNIWYCQFFFNLGHSSGGEWYCTVVLIRISLTTSICFSLSGLFHKCKKGKWLSEEALQIAGKRREAKGKEKRKDIPI